MLVNLAGGPWSGQAYFGALSNSAKEYFSFAGIDEPLFEHFYANLAEEAGVAPLCWGTHETRECVFNRMRCCPYWIRKGDHVKSCRWFSIFDRLFELLPWWWAMCLQLTQLCLKKGVAKSLEDLEACAAQNIQAAKKAAEAVHEAQKGAQPVSGAQAKMMKHGDKDTLSFMRKIKGNLHVASAVSAARLNRALAHMLCMVVQPVRAPHGQAQIRLGTRRSAYIRQAEVASGSWSQELRDIALTLQCDQIGDLGFRPSVGESAAMLEDEEEAELAQYTFSFATALLGQRLLKFCMHSYGMPYKFAHLLHESSQEQQQVLTDLSH